MQSTRLIRLWCVLWFAALSLDIITYLNAGELGLEDDLAARIELELLADPITFPYSWRVEITSRGVELVGVVPGDDVREQAIRLVGQVTSLPVKDRILIQAGPRPVKSLPRSPRELGEAVQQRLEQAHLGGSSGAAEIDIYPDISGIVILRGRVASLADKLLASRCLREVPSCLAVRNHLMVDPQLSQLIPAHSYTAAPYSAEERVVDPFVWRPQPLLVRTAGPGMQTQTASSRVAISANSLPLYPSMRQILNTAVTNSGATSPAPQAYSAGLVVGNGTSNTMPIGYVPPYQAQNAVYASQFPAAYISEPSGQVIRARSDNSTTLASDNNRAYSIAEPTAQSDTYQNVAAGSAILSQPLASAWSAGTTPVIRRRMPQSPASANGERPMPIAGPDVGNGSRDSFSVPASYPSLRNLPSVPSNLANANIVASPATNNLSSIEATTGPTNKPISSLSGRANDELLRQRIASALGRPVSDVQVASGPDRTLRVHVKVASPESVDQAASRLFQMPDLEGYQIKPEFEIQAPSQR